MVWWGWLIIIAVVALATAVVVWVLSRKATKPLLDGEALAQSQARTLWEQLEAEKAATAEMRLRAKDLARQLRANQEWYEKARTSLRKEVRDEYEKLAGDTAALDAKLDELLADDTDPCYQFGSLKPGDQLP